MWGYPKRAAADPRATPRPGPQAGDVWGGVSTLCSRCSGPLPPPSSAPKLPPCVSPHAIPAPALAAPRIHPPTHARPTPQLAQNGPFTITRSVRIYSALAGGSMPSIDFAYLGKALRLQAGTTFTFDGAAVCAACRAGRQRSVQRADCGRGIPCPRRRRVASGKAMRMGMWLWLLLCLVMALTAQQPPWSRGRMGCCRCRSYSQVL